MPQNYIQKNKSATLLYPFPFASHQNQTFAVKLQ